MIRHFENFYLFCQRNQMSPGAGSGSGAGTGAEAGSQTSFTVNRRQVKPSGK